MDSHYTPGVEGLAQLHSCCTTAFFLLVGASSSITWCVLDIYQDMHQMSGGTDPVL